MIDQETLEALKAFETTICNEGGKPLPDSWYRSGACGTLEYYAARTVNGLTLYADVNIATKSVADYFWE